MDALITSRHDLALSARIVRRLPMRYAAGADESLDRPAHVRAASGIAWLGDRLAVVQDDANFLALVDPETGMADAITMPAGAGGLRQFDDARGNKNDKLDLEALAAVVDGDETFLVAFGSGSKRRRDRIVLARGAPMPVLVGGVYETPDLHGALRDAHQFSGSELNVEGAYQCGAMLRLLNRGNGAPSRKHGAVNATCDVNWSELRLHLADPILHAAPHPTRIRQYDLGTLEGIRLTFTDALGLSPERMLYTAAAEASPDASRDGYVAGSAIGIVTGPDDACSARYALLEDAERIGVGAKVEGIALHPRLPQRVFVVIDVDAHDQPSELCEVELSGPWHTADAP